MWSIKITKNYIRRNQEAYGKKGYRRNNEEAEVEVYETSSQVTKRNTCNKGLEWYPTVEKGEEEDQLEDGGTIW